MSEVLRGEVDELRQQLADAKSARREVAMKAASGEEAPSLVAALEAEKAQLLADLAFENRELGKETGNDELVASAEADLFKPGADSDTEDEVVAQDVPDDGAHESDSDYEQMTVPELKQLLEERGLTTGGNKPDLIVRLVENDAEGS